MPPVIGKLIRAIQALAFIVFAYWLGLLAIERLPAGYGVLVLFLVPMIGFPVVVLAFPVEAAQPEDERSPSRSLAERVRLRYKSVN
jgi:hypothetical protein